MQRSTRPPRARARRPVPACLLAVAGLAFALSLVGAPAATAAGSQVGPTGSALVPAGSVASYVVAQADGAPSVFIKGAGGSLWNYWYTSSGWGSHELVPSGVTSSPTVILQSDGSPSVFFAGAGGALWNYWYVASQGVWGSKAIATGVASTPAVGVQSNGAPTIFVQASDGSLVNYFYVASQGIWGAETVAPPGTASSAPAVMGQVNAGGAPSVFVAGPGGSLLNYWYVPWMGVWGSATVAGYTLTYTGARQRTLSDHVEWIAAMRFGDQTLEPSRATYATLGGQALTHVAISTTPFADVYVVLAATNDDGSAVFRIIVNPLVAWIWAGGAVIIAGVVLGNAGVASPVAELARRRVPVTLPA